MKLFNWIKRTFHKFHSPDLRELLVQDYGEQAGKMYDSINEGIPIGGLAETIAFLDAVEQCKKKHNI